MAHSIISNTAITVNACWKVFLRMHRETALRTGRDAVDRKAVELLMLNIVGEVASMRHAVCELVHGGRGEDVPCARFGAGLVILVSLGPCTVTGADAALVDCRPSNIDSDLAHHVCKGQSMPSTVAW